MPEPISDSRNKEVALRRIKRLASSALPLEPFVLTLFELVNDAVPNSPLKAFLPGTDDTTRFICNSPELYAALPAATRFYFKPEMPLPAAGLRFAQTIENLRRLSAGRTLWRHDEMCLPSFHRSEAFKVATSPLGWWRMTMVVLQEEGGVPCGFLPIWRGADQKDFSEADYDFLRACVPHVAHGLRTAQMIEQRAAVGIADFDPSALWGTGIVIMDSAAKVVLMDDEARRAFAMPGSLDKIKSKNFGSRIAPALEYIARTTLAAFHDVTPNGRVPVVSLFPDRSGAVLKLRGTLTVGADEREYITVLVERGETREMRRRRLTLRWGLSDREAQVLEYVAQSKTNPEIAIILSLSPLTVKKHLEHIYIALGVETRMAAASVFSK